MTEKIAQRYDRNGDATFDACIAVMRFFKRVDRADGGDKEAAQ